MKYAERVMFLRSKRRPHRSMPAVDYSTKIYSTKIAKVNLYFPTLAGPRKDWRSPTMGPCLRHNVGIGIEEENKPER